LVRQPLIWLPYTAITGVALRPVRTGFSSVNEIPK
jgi:hypothetical protein